MSRGRHIGRIKLRELYSSQRDAYLHEWTAKALFENLTAHPRLSSKSVFGNEAALEVEIGPGTGEYLCGLAGANPSTNFLGIEASKRAIYYAVHLADTYGLANIRFVRANIKLIYQLIPNNAWHSVYLHFPDPVHKAKDEKHRVFDPEFLDVMARALTEDGQISVVSDRKDFFEEMLRLAERDGRFVPTHAERYLAAFEPTTKSRFQRFWEGKGIKPLRFILRRADGMSR
ncbi:MAG: tRNA (guanosine(46)-N7)-methyltransferase TrmB [Chloroflexi bacterium]|nr:tRNA (guanosine(46)-N7)-methyltransferase TrmB [Chloroflexota bacterium]